MRALISVSDKTGIVDLAKGLKTKGCEILSTGGTAKILRDNGIDVKEVSDMTGFPECLDGRVKTLHPAVHGGILARRDIREHMEQLVNLNIETIDIVVINLYPFKETILKEGVELEETVWIPGFQRLTSASVSSPPMTGGRQWRRPVSAAPRTPTACGIRG